MLHEVRLPQITLERLTDVVVLQIWLLFYAASKPSVGPGDQQDCADKLNNCPRFSGRGDEIAAWMWKAPKTRVEPLDKFASDLTGTQAQKKQWLQQISREIFGLLKQPSGSIEPFDEENAETWQITAANFFISFYEDILRQSSKSFSLPVRSSRSVVGFPPSIFSTTQAEQFGAQEFLAAFRDTNKPALTICPACDEQKYSVSAGRKFTNLGAVKIYADIDHYLPKSLYPHLACHPYNLVPSCTTCNQRKKLDNDPLESASSRNNLEDIFQLYREEGVAHNVFLEVDIDSHGTVNLGQLQPKSGYSPRECITILREIYCIPDGWSEEAETIDERLFCRLRDHFEVNHSPFDEIQIIDWFDYFLSGRLREWGKEPYSILETWLLVAHIQETISVFDDAGNKVDNTEFLRELEANCGTQDSAISAQGLSKSNVQDRIREARSWRESQVA
jgi:hypothetical protein